MSSLNPLSSSFMAPPPPPKPYFEYRTKIVMMCLLFFYCVSIIFLIINRIKTHKKEKQNKINLGAIFMATIGIALIFLFVVFPLNCMIKGEKEGGIVCTVLIAFTVGIYLLITTFFLIAAIGGALSNVNI
jgi:L-asparagine transporter-like permease